MLTLGLVGVYEQGSFRGEFATHLKVQEYVDELFRGVNEQGIIEIPLLFRAVVSSKLVQWRNHALYAGVGALGLLEIDEQKYQIGFGPAFQYSWKFPKKHLELSFDLVAPLLFTGNHDNPPDDDFITEQGWARLNLFFLAPTIGLSWIF